MIENREALMQASEAAKQEIASYDCRILVCSGTGCIATGSQKIYEEFLKIAKDEPGVRIDFAPHDENTHVGVKKTGCQGVCELGPLVRIQKGSQAVQYTKVQISDCKEIFERSVKGDGIVESLLYKQNGISYKSPDEIPFIAKQTRIVLENCGKFDAESFDEYLASGGFSAFQKALFEMTPDEVVDVVDKSGLRGRGGRRLPHRQKMETGSTAGGKGALCGLQRR